MEFIIQHFVEYAFFSVLFAYLNKILYFCNTNKKQTHENVHHFFTYPTVYRVWRT
ncbi:unknown [Bacteroides sp. CAG:702]|nr:unknown [Bacteroides sp. CAG:702]